MQTFIDGENMNGPRVGCVSFGSQEPGRTQKRNRPIITRFYTMEAGIGRGVFKLDLIVFIRMRASMT